MKEFWTLVNFLWAAPVILLCRLLYPAFQIKFGKIRTERFGHFVPEVLFAVIKQKSANKNEKHLFWFSGKISNDYWAEIGKKNLLVFSWVKFLWLTNLWIPGGRHLDLVGQKASSRDTNGLYEKSTKRFAFSKKENISGKAWLENHGWKDHRPFCCLLVRDSKYLESTIAGDWNYHNYRDSSIRNYIPAMEWLADQGVWVLRMGKVMKEPLASRHPRIIDYAFEPDRSDFLDVWLFANCTFCISTGTGPDMIPDYYRKPLLFLNYIPIINLFSWSDAVTSPKKLFWFSSGKKLSLQEFIDCNFLETHQYIKSGICFAEMSPEEILSAVQERYYRMERNYQEPPRAARQQEQFWANLRSHPNYSRLHGWTHPKARVSQWWLDWVLE